MSATRLTRWFRLAAVVMAIAWPGLTARPALAQETIEAGAVAEDDAATTEWDDASDVDGEPTTEAEADVDVPSPDDRATAMDDEEAATDAPVEGEALNEAPGETPSQPVAPAATLRDPSATATARPPASPVDAPATDEPAPPRAGSAVDRERSSGEGLDPRYAVLYQRNMFVRDRHPPRRVERATPPPPPPPPPAVETRYVLLGVLAEDGTYRAYIEDRSDGVMLTVDVGGQVARGRLAAIDLDRVVYESAGGRTAVSLGQNLLGQSPQGAGGVTTPAGDGVESSGAATSGGATARGSSPAASPGASSGEMSVLERMRLRRQRELEESNRQ